MDADAHPLVAVFADESCLGNGRPGANPGGAGGLVEWKRPASGEIQRWDFWISEPATTNNRMALQSVIEAFRALSARDRLLRVVFTSDSKYLIDGMSEWVHSWARRAWTRKGGPIENLSLWHEALSAVGDHKVHWNWVRGHDGHPQNEYANHLATRAAAEQNASGGLRPSAFGEWLEAERAHGRVTADPSDFPAMESFRAGKALPRVSV